MAWHVIKCWDGQDKKLFGRLAALGFDVWRPVVVVRTTQRWKGKPLDKGQRVNVYASVYGNYLFINVTLNESVRAAIREQAGFEDWLCYAGTREPATLPAENISACRDSAFKILKGEALLAVGDVVKVLAGPFATFLGVVEEVDSERDRVKVALSIFGRPTPVELPVGHVEFVEHGKRPPIERDVKQRTRKRA